MSARVEPTPYGIRRAEVWLDMFGAAVSSLPMAEVLASYAAPIEEAAETADRLARELEETTAERNAYVSEIEGEREGRMDLRRRLGAREEETFRAFVERLAAERDAVNANWTEAVTYSSAEWAAEVEEKKAQLARTEEMLAAMTAERDTANRAAAEIVAEKMLGTKDQKMEDRIVERVLDGMAEMFCTGLEMSGQWQAARAIKERR